MNQQNKNIVLAIALVAIVGAIWYIEVHKPAAVAGQSVAITAGDQGLSSDSIDLSGTTSASTSSISPTSTSASRNNQNASKVSAFEASHAATLQQKAAKYSPAVEIVPGGDPSALGTTPFGASASSGFINAAPFTLKSLVGQKVVLIDFWTYSCINCLRTLPYLEAWYAKYKNYGLEIVGIHTPEFAFEKSYDNVAAAVQRLGVTYPVVQDDNMATWNAYNNQYWPNEFLVDIDGYIVHNQIGEGDYDKSEEAIQSALKERAQVLGAENGESAAQIAIDVAAIPTGLVNPSNVIQMNPGAVGSSETYFGSNRNEYLANGVQGQAGEQTLAVPAGGLAGNSFQPSMLQPSALYLGGIWNFQPQYAESVVSSVSDGATGTNSEKSEKIIYEYTAKNVYFVASSQNGIKVTVLLDGKPISASMAGADVAPDGTMTIQANRLYSVVSGTDYGTHTLELDIQGAGLDAYTFTFG
jgi:thiol-disulfide isomerase/thioredoxin